MTAAVFDVGGRLPAGSGVELDAIESFLDADEIDVVVVGGVSDLQAFNLAAGPRRAKCSTSSTGRRVLLMGYGRADSIPATLSVS
jgi:hypothetical protein